MRYYVNIKITKGNIAKQGLINFNFESEIKCQPNREDSLQENLIKEIIDFYTTYFKNELKLDFDDIIIDGLLHSCNGIEFEFIRKGKEIPEQLKEVYEESKKELEEFINSDEEKRLTLKESMKWIIQQLEEIKKQVIELKMLDSQEFINYQDELNKYSIDPDRKDTK